MTCLLINQNAQAKHHVNVGIDAEDELPTAVVSEEADIKIPEIGELSAPTDDYAAEYEAYSQRMGYTEEKVSSIRYKLSLYDEFMEEYEY